MNKKINRYHPFLPYIIFQVLFFINVERCGSKMKPSFEGGYLYKKSLTTKNRKKWIENRKIRTDYFYTGLTKDH